MTGRPSKYTDELALTICEKVATSSKSLRTICKELDITVTSVLTWLRDNESFLAQYTRAKEEQADFMAEEIIEISDDSSDDLLGVDKFGNKLENKEFVNRSRLRVDARKWVASKLKPKKYGDKVDVTSGGEKISQPDMSKLTNEELAALAAIQSKVNAK